MIKRLTLGLVVLACAGGAAVLAAEKQGTPAAGQRPTVQKGAAPSATASGGQTIVPKTAVPEPAVWSQQEIADAQARCKALLKSIDAVAMPEPAIRRGSCGAPAPVRVVSIGKNPEVALSPPPIMTCEMVAALATWLKNDVQPLAKRHLGEPVIKIETMSDYSCRAAYGRIGNKLSEHGRANALDIRGFITAHGQQTFVLAEWGKTQRDIARAIAAAKTAAEKAEKERAASVAAAGSKAPPPNVVVGVPPAALHAQDLASGALQAVADVLKSTISGGTERASDAKSPAETGLTLAPPSRLGGPKTQGQATAALPDPDRTAANVSKKGRFLREAHAAACRIFGTTLGPEANEAHRNHFHVDMAVRNIGRYCE